ncbi:hypothetical protein KBZ21_44740, partial [Streptomyces sp. A73]|nr:hypothetical protein [Streptomyces sp. A73]
LSAADRGQQTAGVVHRRLRGVATRQAGKKLRDRRPDCSPPSACVAAMSRTWVEVRAGASYTPAGASSATSSA